MRKKDNGVKLYNVLFPVWMLFLIPTVWLIILPGNFIIDSAVFLISMLMLKISDKKQWYKKHILKVYIFGWISDLVGAALMLLMLVLEVSRTGDEWYLTVPAVLVSACMIFVFNYFITFRKTDKAVRLRFSLIFAIATAPYTFMIPISWIYY